jgi:hypothetical protein
MCHVLVSSLLAKLMKKVHRVPHRDGEGEHSMKLHPDLGRIRWLLFACSVGLVVALCALVVNVELAIRVFVPSFDFTERLISSQLFAWMTPLGADQSGVTTLVPVLLLAFPLWQGWRRKQELLRHPEAVSHVMDPYPEHFPFFCIMLGLFGTLYGMMIGLSSSGVSGLAVASPSSESIRVALDRLLSGTATALLSSIMGMIGAFLSALPFPAIYRWCTGASAEVEDVDIITSIEQVTSELKALAQAGAEARQQWGGDAIGQVLDRLEQLQISTDRSAAASVHMQESMAAMAQAQAQCAEGLLNGVRAVQESTAQVALGMDALARHEPAHREALLHIAQSGQVAADQLRQVVADLNRQHQAALAEWIAQREASTRQADEVSRDRAALRRALASYAGPSDDL